jgi:hypothetical protein
LLLERLDELLLSEQAARNQVLPEHPALDASMPT